MSHVKSALRGMFIGAICNALGCAIALSVLSHFDDNSGGSFLAFSNMWLFGLMIRGIVGAFTGALIGTFVGALRTGKYGSGAIGIAVNLALAVFLGGGGSERLGLQIAFFVVSGAIAGITVAAWLGADIYF